MATYRITIPISVERDQYDDVDVVDKGEETIELEVQASSKYEAAKKLEKVLGKLLEFGK